MAQLQMLNPPDHPPLAPTYSQICVASLDSSTKLISFSGQPGVGPASDLSSPPSFQTQVRQALRNLDKCLKAAGISKRDIISNRQYIVKPGEMSSEDMQARTNIWLEWLGGIPAPPETFIGVHSMVIPAILYEIEVLAVVKST